MRRIIPLLLVLLSLSGWATEKNPVETKIESVTVYREGATVTRSGKVFLKSGENSLLLKDLAPDIDENSIQISGLNNASVRSILYRIDYLEKKAPSQTYQALQLRQDQIERSIKLINNTVAGYKEELKILGKNQVIHGDQSNISIERVKEMTQYYRDRTITVNNELLNLQYEIDSLKLIKVDLYQEMTALQTEKNEKRGVIEFIIDAPVATAIELSVSYTVATAGWYPTYDIRATSTTAPVDILYKANVYQQTGSDWNDIDLILSTGDPTTNNTKPVLSPKYLNFGTSFSSSLPAQSSAVKYNPTIRKVSGTVVDASGLPLPGVNIIEQNTSNGTQTDFDGNYTLNIQGGRNLIYSYIGFESVVNPIHASRMDLQMQEDPNALDEVVVIAQGIRREAKALGYAVSTVTADDLYGYSQYGVASALSGKASGVNITAQSGASGSATSVVIRGYSSLTGSDEALFVIDGIPYSSDTLNLSGSLGSTSFLDIQPEDIIDVNILKGNAAATLYGTAGRNGVVVITTKSGEGLTGVGNVKFAGLTTMRFEIPKKHTINSDAKITAIDLDKFELAAEFSYYAAPGLNENVFLTAKIKNWEAYDLLQGEANIYFDGNFAGKTLINPNVASKGIQVSLGPDTAIVIARKEKQNFKSKSFLGGNRVLDRAYEITVKNNKPIDVELIIEDRIPISQNKEIKVEDMAYGDGNYNEQTGIIRWTLKLPPKATGEKSFSFTVKHPKEEMINL
ncbi:mucoidy inhibitor MuiA family protein [Gilvibacter sediminis]|uniref:mucoidy inhibitor MuiA family protein n=1 Tax=Gilvibacter sediminis TaxID=379071 RepID=UPI00234FCCD6|nr:mucoidy inhibitor MuiA family protein [Gilvibacter sediminis]MDC7998349.1 mucoidy inhibitor MuiA family protein [Gilvibacter sediminis]